ncbi:MAG TPA: hypothetical protein ENF77_00285 [Candidatus Acetothermia bacterium]|nr:hypothetical protein [Candidatus Acetothermia bacterium]
MKRGLVLGLISVLALVPLAWGQEQTVVVNAEIGAKLIFSIVDGAEIVLKVDPLDQPYAEGWTNFQVKTNAPYYNVVAYFGSFAIGDYDLIEHGNFKIWSKTEGDGAVITDPVVPAREQEILTGETGYTNGETFGVGYALTVDFTVPAGEAETTVVFVASMSL